MNVISTINTSGIASGKIQTALTPKTILARTGMDGTAPALVIPSGLVAAAGTSAVPADGTSRQASVSDPAGIASSSLFCVDGGSRWWEMPRQPADAALADTLACFWLYMKARSSAPKGTTSRNTN